MVLEILSTNRDLKDIVEGEGRMIREIKLEDLPTGRLMIYEKGIEKGIEKEKMEIIERGLKNGVDVRVLSMLTGIDEKKIKEIKRNA